MVSMRAAWRVGKRMAKASLGMKIALIVVPFAVFFVMVTIVLSAGGGAVAALGDKLIGFAGLGKSDLAWVDEVDPELLKDIREEIGDDVSETLDCSNFAPSEADPGVNCIEGLIETEDGSPIPASAEWMVPVWQAAAKRYDMPWELLAAVNATRTRFGRANCDDQQGLGFYRLHESAWEKYMVDAGTSKVERTVVGCYQAGHPTKIFKNFEKPWKRGEAEPGEHDLASFFDGVDSTYTAASMLARHDAFGKKEWDYAGSPSNSCTGSESDGRIYYLPSFEAEAGIGSTGYNKKLDLPQWIIVDSAKWRKAHPPSTSPSGALSNETLIKYLTTVWMAFGEPKPRAEANARANLAQVIQESGGRSHAIQTVIDVNSGGNEAGGLVQFIPPTFDYWKVDGFDDRFSPLDNLLAAVNAQVNADSIATTGGTVEVLSGTGGWGPVGGSNPYSTGGVKANVNDLPGGGSGPAKEHPYKGKPQDDAISKAVAYDSQRTMSPCYVAVVNDWYEEIKKHPPDSASLIGSGGPANVMKTIKLSEPREYKNLPASLMFPGYPVQPVDARIYPAATWLLKEYDMRVTAAREAGHASHGDGTSLDIVPAPGKAWETTTEAGASAIGWEFGCASTCVPQVLPKMPDWVRWVGYNGTSCHGDPEHIFGGCGAHLHISWAHEPAGAVGTLIDPHPVVYTFPSGPGGGGGGGGDDGGGEVDGGRILEVGDSLSVGMQSFLEDEYGDRITVDAYGGRNSTQALAVLKERISGAHQIAVYAVGGNDLEPFSTLESNLKEARKVTGNRCLVVMTAHVPGKSAEVNERIRGFAESTDNVEMFDWYEFAVDNPGLLAPDNIHGHSPAAYEKIAEPMIDAIESC